MTTHVPEDGDLGVVDQTLGHDLGGAELVATNENVDVRSVLGEICRVSATSQANTN
jgi:hypothetical protein